MHAIAVGSSAPRSRAARRARAARVVLALFSTALPAAVAGGQGQVLGAQDCEKCHKAAVRTWKTEEPAQLGGKAHANTHKQLRDPQAARYAEAIGLGNPLDPKGRCASCHATVVRSSLRSGVSCESCHGPASLWNPVHDKEPLAESYKKSIPLGLRDLHNKPAAIAAVCVGCHVTPEGTLAAAGHPTGAGFDAGASLRKLVHWTSAFTGDGAEHASYDYAQVSSSARPLVQKALARAATKPAVAVATPRPPATPSAGAPPTAAAAPLPPAPWDWDQPVAELPADYPSDADTTSASDAEATTAAAPGGPTARAARAARRSLSIVLDQPALAPPEVAAPPVPLAGEGAAPAGRNLTADAAALRGQAGELLADLLAKGRRVPDIPAPAKPREFKGPDSELLNIQDVALYLALETLRAAGRGAGGAAQSRSR